MCSDKTIRIYHTNNFELYQLIYDNNSYKPQNVVTKLLIIESLNVVYSTGNRICRWKLEK